MKTLYVSDLDGTLLRSDQKTSKYTNRIVNQLVENGMLFSYATARSYYTAHKVTAGMTAAFPTVLYNGVFVQDNATREMLMTNLFARKKAVDLIRELTDSFKRRASSAAPTTAIPKTEKDSTAKPTEVSIQNSAGCILSELCFLIYNAFGVQ